MDRKDYNESKYIQQHLANERTYLAWIRTAIALIGLGFLATTLHVNNVNYNDTIAVLISLFSITVGLVTIVVATVIYLRNQRTINTQTFHSSFKIIIFMTIVVCLILILFTFYYFIF